MKKKRRRNEARIRELEAKLKDLEQLFPEESPIATADSRSVGQEQCLNITPPNSFQYAPSDDFTSSRYQSTVASTGLCECQDASGASPIKDETQIATLCNFFCSEMLSYYPFVFFKPFVQWAEIKVVRPALYRAVLATASSVLRPNLWEALFKDAQRYVIEETMIQGKKSLDLVQAALVLSTWIYPPTSFHAINVNQLISLAVTMVAELHSSDNFHQERALSCQDEKVFNPEPLEIARTFSACYLLNSRCVFIHPALSLEQCRT